MVSSLLGANRFWLVTSYSTTAGIFQIRSKKGTGPQRESQFFLGQNSTHYDRDVTRTGMLAQPPQHLPAIYLGHHHIQDNDLRGYLFRQAGNLLGILRADKAIAGAGSVPP